MSDGAFEKVLAEAGEDPPGPRPDDWDGRALLASMLEGVAALRAEAAARHAAGASHRQAARELYEQTRAAHGLGPAPVPPWLADDGPEFRFYGSTEGMLWAALTNPASPMTAASAAGRADRAGHPWRRITSRWS